jgi:restriction system protein
MTSTEYHFAPDFLNLLVETIPRLNRSKNDVLLFFRGAGVGMQHLQDLEGDIRRDRGSHSKFELARTVVVRLNEGGDPCLAARREIVRRIVEFEDFTRCWENDALQARGLVAEVRRLVNVKDSFTRINQERQRERDRARAVREAEVTARREARERIEQVKREFFALFAETDAHRRGRALEVALNRLFAAYGIQVREAFTLRLDSTGAVEQVDGVVELGGHLYLVEMKWWNAPLGPGETAHHLVRVFSRDGARGIFISASGYTEAAIEQYRQALRQRVVFMMTLEEIVGLFNDDADMSELLKYKVTAAVLDKEPFKTNG